MLRQVMVWAGRVIGSVCGAAAALAWSFAMWVPSAGLTLSGVSFVVAFAMALLALFAAIAAVRGHYTVLTLMFLASFFPVGAFLLTADHWLRVVGVLDLGFLTAAALLRFAATKGASPRAGAEERAA